MRSSQREPVHVNEERAAALLGLSTVELRRLSREFGLGSPTPDSDAEHRMFTYAELYQMCRFAVQVPS